MYFLNNRLFQMVFLVSVVLSLVVACGSTDEGNSHSASDSGYGSIVYQVVWPGEEPVANTRAFSVGAMPADVQTVRFFVTGPGMDPMQKDFPASARSGSIDAVPAGTDRTLTLQALSASGDKLFEGSVTGLTLVANVPFNAGDVVMVLVGNLIPMANAGADQYVTTSSTITLNGSASSDANGDTLTYVWSFDSKPVGSGAVLSSTTVVNPTFLPDTYGSYVLRLVVNDGTADSSTDMVTIFRSGTAYVAKTGQTTSYATGDDGDLQPGVAWPVPRFTDNADGTVTDHLTDLIWLQDANCFGAEVWASALTSANALASGSCGLTDGSAVGDWRLPNRRELVSLLDRSNYNPALSTGHPFTIDSSVSHDYHWTSSTYTMNTSTAWYVDMADGLVSHTGGNKTDSYHAWPVRGGQ